MTIFSFMHLLGFWLDSVSLSDGAIPFIIFLIFTLMPSLPIALFWYLDKKRNPAEMKRIQQLLRASAGSDELLVRQLQETRSRQKGDKFPRD